MGVSCNQRSENDTDVSVKDLMPAQDNQSQECKDALEKYFPGVKTGKESEQKFADVLMKRGFTDDNTLFTDSSCPDELNHDDPGEDITSLFQIRWGEIFPLGGLGGLPFTGKTGWGAFSSHCPSDGNIVVLFAPHVGVANTGQVGKVVRDGQDFASSACGAGIGAFGFNQTDSSGAEFPNGYLDHQMDCIKHLLHPHTQEIAEAECQQAALVFKMYDILLQMLEEILNSNWMGPNSQLALCGGIMINCDGEGTDRFLPLMFEVRKKDGSKEDLFLKTFGAEAIHYKTNPNVKKSVEQ